MLRNPWLKIVLAIGFEDGWVVGLKHANQWWEWGLTLIALGLSFLLFRPAVDKLPVGPVYAVFVGLGSAATVLTGWLVFGDKLGLPELLFLAILLGGVIGLKLITEEHT